MCISTVWYGYVVVFKVERVDRVLIKGGWVLRDGYRKWKIERKTRGG